jgi:16S rRNA (uracil1498-N3)-methyltransferase
MTPDSLASSPRLYVTAPIVSGAEMAVTDAQSHYLLAVMRCVAGDVVRVFNGRDGEWRARVAPQGKRRATLRVEAQQQPQIPEPGPWLLFAPLKSARLDPLVEKATELGVARLMPVITHRTVVTRVNLQRLAAISIEAAEQCERLTVPQIDAPRSLADVLQDWPSAAPALYFCDEAAVRGGHAVPIIRALDDARDPAAFLVGPEGGFDPAEQNTIRACSFTTSVTLGPRILRAETAAIAALSCWQGVFSRQGVVSAK